MSNFIFSAKIAVRSMSWLHESSVRSDQFHLIGVRDMLRTPGSFKCLSWRRLVTSKIDVEYTIFQLHDVGWGVVDTMSDQEKKLQIDNLGYLKDTRPCEMTLVALGGC